MSRAERPQHDPRAWPEADVLAASLVRQKDALLAALRGLVARCERELVDPIDVDELQYAKSLIADAEQTRTDV